MDINSVYSKYSVLLYTSVEVRIQGYSLLILTALRKNKGVQKIVINLVLYGNFPINGAKIEFLKNHVELLWKRKTMLA